MATPSRKEDGLLALLLGCVGGAATVAVIPYVVALQGKPTSMINWRKALPLGFSQGAFINAAVAYAGLRWAHKCGLDAPILRQLVAPSSATPDQGDKDANQAEPVPRGRFALRPVLLSSAVGVGVGTALVALDYWVFPKFISSDIRDEMSTGGVGKNIPILYRALACLYGGFVEELQLRLFVMSGSCAALSWAGRLFRRFFGSKKDEKEEAPAATNAVAPVKQRAMSGVHITASVISSFLFAAGHLPTAFAVMANHPEIPSGWFISRVLTLNFIAGMPFSLLYSKYSLEYSMIAHFLADVMMHVLLT